jgi:prephenate dehydratase
VVKYFQYIKEVMNVKYLVLGPEGTFTDLAYQKIKNDDDIADYRSSIEDVLSAVSEDALGIVPIENTLDGYIQPSLDGIFKNRLWIIDEIRIPIAFSLIGNIHVLDDIRKLYVQFATKGQCRDFIEKLSDVSIVLTESNSGSFQSVKNAAFGEAAIVPSHLIESKNPFILPNVADKENNETRFVIVSKKKQILAFETYRVTFIVTPVIDRPGLLYDILGTFNTFHINLTSILSRPTREHMGKYHFFLEIKLSGVKLENVIEILSKSNDAYALQVIGICPFRDEILSST